jgi:transcriptional regulator GlxA family with amidase domain
MFHPYKTHAAPNRHNRCMNRREVLLAGAAGLAACALTAPVLAADAKPLKLPKNKEILVAFVAGSGANVMDIAGSWEVFQDTMVPELGASMEEQMPFRMALVSDSKQAFPATGNLMMTPHFSFDEQIPQPNVIVMGAQGEHTPRKIAWIREAAKKADVVMSVCTGAFLLAQTGLLDGMQATTHHEFYDSFAKQFPKVALVRGPRYIENDGGRICTAGGLTSGIELALRVVNRYFGDAAASRTAYYMEYKRSPERPTA